MGYPAVYAKLTVVLLELGEVLYPPAQVPECEEGVMLFLNAHTWQIQYGTPPHFNNTTISVLNSTVLSS